jgi:branched-chain amino acid aminotransferase
MQSGSVWRVLAPGRSSKIELIQNVGPLLTLNEISAKLPPGVYTTIRTFECHKSLPLDPQFSRLEESAALMNVSVAPIDRNHIRAALREAMQLYQDQDKRIRLTLDLEDRPGTIYISIEPLTMPRPADYTKGVITLTGMGERRNPKAKYTSFISFAEKTRDQIPENVNEVLLVNSKGQILEGLSSNFFAVRQNEIWTDDQNVLSGIVRSMVLEVARIARIPVHLTAIQNSELKSIEEAFLTGTSRSVLPIHKINEQIVGTGKPGPITKKLMDDYHQMIQRQVQEI